LLVVAVAVHEVLIQGSFDALAMALLAAALGGYAIISWIALETLAGPEPRAPSPVFTILDLAGMAVAVHMAGADESWLFWIFVLRVIEPASPTVRRALVTAGLGVGAYLGVLGWAALVDGAAVAWPAQAARLAFLALGGAYAALLVARLERERTGLITEADNAGRAKTREAGEREHELARSRDEARAESLARSRFLERLARELRGHLTGLIGLAQGLEAEPLTDRQGRAVRAIKQRGLYVRRLVDEVRDIARVETGAVDVHPVALEPALRDVLDRARPAAKLRDVRLPEDPPVEAWVWVMANERKLRQVFANLLSNAIRYNSSPGEVRLSCEYGPGTIRVAVTDTGPGIPAERIPTLFQPFNRPEAEPGRGGTGLGLTVARSLAQGMGGRIGVESYPGAGSTFWFELELIQAPSDVTGAPEPERPTVIYIGSGQENRMLIDRILSRRRAVDLVAHANGTEGLEAVRSKGPDLILLERILPDMAGQEALRRLQQEADSQEIPVLIVSSEAVPEEAERLREAGARACFTLPYDVVAFRDAIDALLRLRENGPGAGDPPA
jgi:signal transduction histidine kinase/CheY-like chemotaxis protein